MNAVLIQEIPEALEFDEYANFENLKAHFGDQTSRLSILLRAGQSIEKLTNDGLRSLIHYLIQKWPHTVFRKVLILGAKRIIQTRYYKEIYQHEPSHNVLKANEICLSHLDLRDIPYQAHAKIRKPVKRKVLKMPEVNAKPAKPAKPKSEFSQKVSGMTLENLINWAKEMGVAQESIDKHKTKPVGLAKMNISNLIRGKLKK